MEEEIDIIDSGDEGHLFRSGGYKLQIPGGNHCVRQWSYFKYRACASIHKDYDSL